MSDISQTQTGDYIPRRDGLFRSWAHVFAAEVAMDPEALGLTLLESIEISEAAASFNDAYNATVSAKTRTPKAVSHKRRIRKDVERLLRGYAQRVKRAPGVPVGKLRGLGIHLDDPTRTRIGPPLTAPALFVKSAPQACVHVLRYADQNLFGDSGRRPHGVAYLQIYAAVGVGAVSDVCLAEHLGDYTRQPIRITWPPALTSKTVSYFGRWCNGKGEPGPWSLPVSLMIAGAAGPEVSDPGLTAEEQRAVRSHLVKNRSRDARRRAA